MFLLLHVCDLGTWCLARDYDITVNHKHMIAISDIPCWLSTGKVSGEAGKKLKVAIT